MDTARCHFLFQSRLTASSLVAAACALAAALLNPAQVCAQVTTTPPSVAVANPLYMPTIDSTAVIFDLRDAPVRQALEMLLNAGKSQFSIDNKVAGFISMRTSDRSLHSALDLICFSSAQPLDYKYDKSVFYIGPKPSDAQNAPTVIPTAASPSQPPASVTDVPRRVAGVLILKSGPAYAILETGAPYSPTTRVSVVEYKAQENASRVPSGVPGVADLRVTGIDATGLTLSGEDGTTIHVPLAGAVSH